MWGTQARVSTGTPGHPTPMGVFSVIEKDRYHRSNLYDSAPMFYMHRLTWSGVAMHEGILPGYAASHGCIRMPTDFVSRLWQPARLHTVSSGLSSSGISLGADAASNVVREFWPEIRHPRRRR